MTVAEAIADYLCYLRDDKRASPHSVDAARRDLAHFERLCDESGVTTPNAIDVHLVRRHVATLHAGGRQPRSVQRMLSSLRSWLRRELVLGRIASNPAQGVRPPKGQRTLPRSVDADTLSAAFDRAATDDDAWATRDRAMLELLYGCGLRLSELQALDVPAGNVPDVLRVLGKGAKTRVVPVGRHARDALRRWLAERRTLAVADEPALFVGRSGTRLGHRAIQSRVAAWAQRNGLPTHLHPHRLRHAFATHLLENSGNLRAVQELLGHANLATTQIYTQLDWKHLARVYDGSHPRAKRR